MDWRTIKDEKEKYQAYLCSREWSEKKNYIRMRSDNKCERCFNAPMQACHHLTYARKYDERHEDLQAICNACHDFIHGKRDVDPAKIPFDAKFGPDYEVSSNDKASFLKCPRCNWACACNEESEITRTDKHITLLFDCPCCGVSFDLRIPAVGYANFEICNVYYRYANG